MNIVKVTAGFETLLKRGITAAAASAELNSYTDRAGNALSGLYGFTFDEGEATQEFAVGTISSGVITFTLRGVDPTDPTVEVAALKFPHRKNSSVKITNYAVLGQLRALANGSAGFPNELVYAAAPALTDPLSIPYKSYVQSLSLAAGGITPFYVAEVAGPSLNISIGAGNWMRGDDIVTYAGTGSTAVTNNATNYVQLQPDGTILINTSGFVAGNLPIYEVVASGGDITTLTDRRPWLTLAMVKRTVSLDFTLGATLSVNDPVRVDATASNKLIKALATTAANADGFIGVMLDAGVDTNTNKRVQIAGLVTGVSGLTSNAPVFLTDAGGFSASAGTYSKVVGWAVSTTAFILLRSPRIEDVAGANAATTTANLQEVMTLINTTDITGAELETLSAGITQDATSLHHHANLIASSINAALTANTSEQTVATGTLPAGVLSTKHGVRIMLAVTHTAAQNGDDVTLKFKLGGTTVATVTLAGSIGVVDKAHLEVIILNTSASAQKYSVVGIEWSGTGPAFEDAGGTAAVDTSGSVAVAVTSQTVADGTNAVTVHRCTIEYLFAV